jgi:hypothetical protein
MEILEGGCAPHAPSKSASTCRKLDDSSSKNQSGACEDVCHGWRVSVAYKDVVKFEIFDCPRGSCSRCWSRPVRGRGGRDFPGRYIQYSPRVFRKITGHHGPREKVGVFDVKVGAFDVTIP